MFYSHFVVNFSLFSFEVFVEAASLMLQEWRLLLQHSSTTLTSSKLVQIMAINMFSIDNTVLKGTGTVFYR
jgi:hypothetical protein